jgi:hypothetical protein
MFNVLLKLINHRLAAWLDAELDREDLGALNVAKPAIKAWYHRALGVPEA